MLRWTWDDRKDRINRQKHGLSFATASLVLGDPLGVQRLDPNSEEERWLTIGRIGEVVVIVSHTWPELEPETGVETGRIISARKATARERRVYEEGDF